MFNSKQRDSDIAQLETIFSKYLEVIKIMCPNLTENEINDNFKRTMKEISFIRVDETDTLKRFYLPLLFLICISGFNTFFHIKSTEYMQKKLREQNFYVL